MLSMVKQSPRYFIITKMFTLDILPKHSYITDRHFNLHDTKKKGFEKMKKNEKDNKCHSAMRYGAHLMRLRRQRGKSL